ncbi:MAG: DUF2569 family protein [Gammaproteobacteria bacterium]
MFDTETIKELMRSVIRVVVWVPNMLVSKRVKAAFFKQECLTRQIQPTPKCTVSLRSTTHFLSG